MAKFGPIKVRTGGWFVKQGTIKNLSLSERLVDFLNVDPINEYDIDKYCEKTGYHPLDISSGWAEGFKAEQQPVREMADKIVSGKIGNSEIDEIAQRLKNVVMRARVLTEAQLENLNEDLYLLNKKSGDYYKILDESGDKKYLIYVREYITPIDVMWGSIFSSLQTTRPLKKCKDTFRCTRFFIPSLKNPNQDYCTPEHENRHKHRMVYNKKAVK